MRRYRVRRGWQSAAWTLTVALLTLGGCWEEIRYDPDSQSITPQAQPAPQASDSSQEKLAEESLDTLPKAENDTR